MTLLKLVTKALVNLSIVSDDYDNTVPKRREKCLHFDITKTDLKHI